MSLTVCILPVSDLSSSSLILSSVVLNALLHTSIFLALDIFFFSYKISSCFLLWLLISLPLNSRFILLGCSVKIDLVPLTIFFFMSVGAELFLVEGARETLQGKGFSSCLQCTRLISKLW